MKFTTDTRGASIPITHAMTIAITALLMASLLVGAGTFLSNQQETAARAQLQDVAGDVAGQLHTLDQVNRSGAYDEGTFEPSYKRLAGGAPYSIELVPQNGPQTTNATLFVNSTGLDSSIRLPINTTTIVEQGSVRGEDPTVSLCERAGNQYITLGECS